MAKKRVEILSRFIVFKELFFQVEKVRLRHELLDGRMSPPMVRLTLERGDGVAALLHDTEQDQIILVEQFRYPTLAHAGGWLLEIPAGILKAGEDPAEAMRRELLEETGYQAATLQPISTFYLSPGGSTERIFLFYAPVRATDRVEKGGGLPAELEEICLVTVPRSQAMQQLAAGEFQDAKTLIALLWLQANHL